MEEKEVLWPEKEVSNIGEVFGQSLVSHGTSTATIVPPQDPHCIWQIYRIYITHHGYISIENVQLKPVIHRHTDHSNKLFMLMLNT